MKHLAPEGKQNLAMAIAMLIVSVISVALRFTVRITAGLPLIVADWLIMPALIAMLIYLGVLIEYIISGPGPGSFDIPWMIKQDQHGAEWVKSLLKDFFIVQILYIVAITFLKFSILAFYHQLFSVSRVFRLANIATAIACLLWLVVMLFIVIFQCRPIHMVWDSYLSSDYCLSSNKIWFGAELSNLFLDITVLSLPVALILRLNLNTARKLSLIAIFLIGILACAASLVKLIYTWGPQWDLDMAFPEALLMMSLQLGLAFLCACLPTYAPLFYCNQHRLNSGRSYSSRSFQKAWTSSPRRWHMKNSGNDSRPYEPMPDYQHPQRVNFEAIEMGDVGSPLPTMSIGSRVNETPPLPYSRT